MADNRTAFQEYSKYYDLLYKDKDYFGEAETIHTLIQQFAPGAKALLEVGSGTGKHALFFAEMGYNVLGIEPSKDMFGLAKLHENNRVHFQNTSISNFTSAEPFDAAVALFHVVSYLNENEELIRSFKRVHDSLSTGGIFLFDVWFTPAVLTQLPEKRTKEIKNEDLTIVREAIPEIDWKKNIVTVNYNIDLTTKKDGSQHHFSEKHLMRHFGIPELRLVAEQTGFEMIHVQNFYSRSEVGPEIWDAGFIFRKKGKFS